MDFFQQMTRVFEAPIPTVNRRGFRQTAGDMVVSFLQVQAQRKQLLSTLALREKSLAKRSQLVNLLVLRADDLLWKGLR